MKGLLLKEYYNVRKLLPLIFGLVIIFYILGFLIILSFNIGNLGWLYAGEDTQKAMGGVNMLFGVLVPLIMGFSGAMTVCETFEADRKCNWNKYLYSLPPGNKESVGAKYLLALIITAAALLVCMAMAALFAAANNELEINRLKSPMTIFCASSAFSFIILAANFYFDKKSKTDIFGAVIMAIPLLCMGFYVFSGPANERTVRTYKIAEMMKDNVNLIPIALVAVIVSGYLVSVKFAGRRERLC